MRTKSVAGFLRIHGFVCYIPGRMEFSTLRTKNHSGDLIYLDHNATAPLGESVRDQLGFWAQSWGNPSSIHQAGRGPKALLRESRDAIAQMVGVQPLELIFTAGGSEANNMAIKGVFESWQKTQAQKPNSSEKIFRNHYLFSAVEHPSIMKTAEYLASRGATVEFIPVSRKGEIDMQAYRSLLRGDTALVSVMLANNETGSVFPIEDMARLAHEVGAYFHSDCVQALGKMPLNLRALGIDLASFAGHKFYALKGAGVLYVKKGTLIETLIHGGGQERHRRGGTENVLAIASLGFMCELKDQVEMRAVQMRSLRDQLEARLLKEIADIEITGAENPRLPNTSSLIIAGVDGEALLMNLDLKGFAVSTGAACSSGSPEPSPVLLAMGLTRKEAQSSLRIGIGWGTTQAEIDRFFTTLVAVVRHLRSLANRQQLSSIKFPVGLTRSTNSTEVSRHEHN